MNSSDVSYDFHLRIGWLPFSIYILVHGTLLFFIVVGNLVVIITMAREKFTQSPSNIFLCSLAVVDLLTGIIALPPGIFARVVISKLTCLAGYRPLFFVPAFACCGASVFTLMAITVDRLIAVSWPLRYSQIMTKGKCKIIIASTWFLGIGLSIIPVFSGLDTPNKWVCGNIEYEPGAIVVHSFIVASITPTLSAVLLLAYARIFMIAQRHVKDVAMRRRTGMDEEKVRSLESKSLMKATVTAVLVVLLFIICWLPQSAKLVLDSLLEPSEEVQFIYQTAVEFLAYFNSAVNPIIYALRNRKYKEAYESILCFCVSNQKKNKENKKTFVNSTVTGNTIVSGSSSVYQ